MLRTPAQTCSLLGEPSSGWFTFDSKCIYVSKSVVDFNTALEICKLENSVIYTPRNEKYLPSVIQSKMPSNAHWIGYYLKIELTLGEGTDQIDQI